VHTHDYFQCHRRVLYAVMTQKFATKGSLNMMTTKTKIQGRRTVRRKKWWTLEGFRSLWQDARRRFFSNHPRVISLVIAPLIAAIALLAPVIQQWHYEDIDWEALSDISGTGSSK